MFAEVRQAAPYAALTRRDFDDVLGFVENGGYALAAYDRYRKLFRDSEGLVHIRSERIARMARMNLGTIVEAPLLKVRYAGRGGPNLGEVEESFVNMMTPGDTFMFAGRLLRFLRIRETTVEVADGGDGEPMVPAYAGARQPLTTNLAARVRAMLHDHGTWRHFPEPVQEWLALQQERSELPGPDDLLVETFPRNGRWYLVAYCFEGRNAHQTLGMLLTRRMERFGYAPLGFVATDYVIATWSAHEPTDVAPLFEQDMLGDDLEAWMAESSMLRRTFRNVAVIAGLVERNQPGAERTRRQVTVNTDLIYDVLRRHQPDHVLLRATRADAASGLTDLGRVAAMLGRVAGRVRHVPPHPRLAARGAGAAGHRARIGAHARRRGFAAGGDGSVGGGGHRPGGTEPAADAGARRPSRQPGDPATQARRPEAGVTAVPVRFAGHDLLLDPLGGRRLARRRAARGRRPAPGKGLRRGRRRQPGPALGHGGDARPARRRCSRRWRPVTVVALGDSFHDRHGFARMAPADAARLARAGRGFAASSGCSATTTPTRRPGLGGTVTPCWAHGGLEFCHQARPGHGPELVGHHHPKASIPTRAGTVTRPCFVVGDRRLMLPALGAFTGGLDVAARRSPACFPRGGRAFLLGQGRLFELPAPPTPRFRQPKRLFLPRAAQH